MINNLRKICRDCSKFQILYHKKNDHSKKMVLQEILLAQVSSRAYLEAAPGYSVAKTEWKFWLIGTENMSVEMGLCARAMSIRKG